jgi:hypothetical protein
MWLTVLKELKSVLNLFLVGFHSEILNLFEYCKKNQILVLTSDEILQMHLTTAPNINVLSS